MKGCGSVRIIVFAPHTDDGELGCGGTIARYLEEGAEIFYVAFSTAESSVPEGWPQDILKREVKAATAALGIREDHLLIYNYEVRKLNYVRQEVLETMIRLRTEIMPNMVLLPSASDIHQDHQVVSSEGLRAFKHCTVLGYELPWNHLEFSTGLFIRLQEHHITSKIDALACYESQQGRPYFDPEFVRSLARVRGVQIGCQYAEAFDVLRVVL